MRPVTACNLCGGTRWKTREESPPFRVAECDCGLVFVTPQPARVALAAAYDRAYYEEWQDQARRRERLWARRLAAVEALGPARGLLLDVGCGDGAFLRLARARGWEVAGTELSPYAVGAAKADGLAVREGEVWEAGFAAAAFDVVTCWHVLEHTSDPRRVVEEIRRVLRPGGRLMLATPNIQDHIFRAAYVLARGRRPRLFEPDDREVHLFHFSPRTLRELVAATGLEVVRVGFDRGGAAEGGKGLVNALAYVWFRLTGLNWGMALELVALKPENNGETPRGVVR